VLYQLPNGKTIYLTLEEFLSLTDQDLQYLVSLDLGEAILNPFKGSATVDKSQPEKEYDFDYLINDEEDEPYFNTLISGDDEIFFDDIIDIPDDMDI
jgi:hypothetical protein